MAHFESSSNGRTVYFIHNGNRINTARWDVNKRKSFEEEIKEIKEEIKEIKNENDKNR